MKQIQSIIGRRKFLIGAFATSTLGLVYSKIARSFWLPTSQARMSVGSKRTGPVDLKGEGKRYSHLLSPLKMGNVILKNRMLYTVSIPQYLQGPETFPTEEIRSYYANVAKNAAVVTVPMSTGRKPREELQRDHAHMASWDGDNPSVHNYIDQMAESIHSMGSLVSASCGGTPPGTTVKIDDSEGFSQVHDR